LFYPISLTCVCALGSERGPAARKGLLRAEAKTGLPLRLQDLLGSAGFWRGTGCGSEHRRGIQRTSLREVSWACTVSAIRERWLLRSDGCFGTGKSSHFNLKTSGSTSSASVCPQHHLREWEDFTALCRGCSGTRGKSKKRQVAAKLFSLRVCWGGGKARGRCHLALRCEKLQACKHFYCWVLCLCGVGPRVFSASGRSILCGGWKVSSFLLGTTARGIRDCLTNVKIHTHKPGAIPKDFSALPIFTTVNIAVDDKSENEYVVVLLRKGISSCSWKFSMRSLS